MERVVIENLRPRVDGFAVKCVLRERVLVVADVFADGHDCVRARLLARAPTGEERSYDMQALINDAFTAEFSPDVLGTWTYCVEGWVDAWGSWRKDAERRPKLETVHLETGARLLERAEGLKKIAARLRQGELPQAEEEAVIAVVLPPRFVTRSEAVAVCVEPERARFSAWYELFPRSVGTLRDVALRVPELAALGFDVLYLPPIHPIGRVNRKGKNNSVVALPDDVGSPWAIGAKEGGHDAVHPSLGTVEDVRALSDTCRAHGMDLALDLAFQCAPDHPWVTAHPEWFLHRPDGSIQFAENPPKKYEDILPFDFACEDCRGLWRALLDVVRHWLKQGVRVFRVDNPHTKPFAFWEYLVGSVKAENPEVIFLAEAFTRPKVMQRLAKLGFSQSYTYFTWRNAKWEIEEYLRELSRTRDFFRPNFWPVTPDILPEYLQHGGRAAFLARLVLAATLCPSYGIYGPAFELCEARGKGEEFLDSEKYEIKHWPPKEIREAPLRAWLGIVNRIRHEHPALQNDAVEFHRTDNENIVCYSRVADADLLVVVVNVDPFHAQRASIEVDLSALGFPDARCQARDALSEQTFSWQGAWHSVTLDPQQIPAQIFHLRHFLRRENDFEYFA